MEREAVFLFKWNCFIQTLWIFELMIISLLVYSNPKVSEKAISGKWTFQESTCKSHFPETPWEQKDATQKQYKWETSD
jgi:hypothetical protein